MDIDGETANVLFCHLSENRERDPAVALPVLTLSHPRAVVMMLADTKDLLGRWMLVTCLINSDQEQPSSILGARQSIF